MKKLFPFVIYLLGYFSSYQIGKHYTINFNHTLQKKYPNQKILEWSTKDRNFVLLISVGSWFTCVAYGIIEVTKEIDNDYNKPANW